VGMDVHDGRLGGCHFALDASLDSQGIFKEEERWPESGGTDGGWWLVAFFSLS
jgi:hypothetical protein